MQQSFKCYVYEFTLGGSTVFPSLLKILYFQNIDFVNAPNVEAIRLKPRIYKLYLIIIL